MPTQNHQRPSPPRTSYVVVLPEDKVDNSLLAKQNDGTWVNSQGEVFDDFWLYVLSEGSWNNWLRDDWYHEEWTQFTARSSWDPKQKRWILHERPQVVHRPNPPPPTGLAPPKAPPPPQPQPSSSQIRSSVQRNTVQDQLPTIAASQRCFPVFLLT